jgi:hypothetical protein
LRLALLHLAIKSRGKLKVLYIKAYNIKSCSRLRVALYANRI